MNSQIYTAASGMLVETRRLELITHNLANVTTDGFRAQRALVAEQVAPPRAAETFRQANRAVALVGSYEQPSSGVLRPTGRGLDVALADGNLLAVSAGNASGYTRAGSLRISPDGTLVDAMGRAVQGAGGKPITGLIAGSRIAPDGRVLNGTQELGRLRIVSDPSRVLERLGGNLLSARGRDRALREVNEPELRPGFLEGSGTQAVQELVEMLEAQRGFESYRRLISLADEINRKLINELGDA